MQLERDSQFQDLSLYWPDRIILRIIIWWLPLSKFSRYQGSFLDFISEEFSSLSKDNV